MDIFTFLYDFSVAFIMPLVVGIVGTIIAIMLHRNYKLKEKDNEKIDKLTEMIEKQNRILFGEDGVESWDGLIKMMIDQQKQIECCKFALSELINKLRKEDVIDYDADVRIICSELCGHDKKL